MGNQSEISSEAFSARELPKKRSRSRSVLIVGQGTESWLLIVPAHSTPRDAADAATTTSIPVVTPSLAVPARRRAPRVVRVVRGGRRPERHVREQTIAPALLRRTEQRILKVEALERRVDRDDVRVRVHRVGRGRASNHRGRGGRARHRGRGRERARSRRARGARVCAPPQAATERFGHRGGATVASADVRAAGIWTSADAGGRREDGRDRALDDEGRVAVSVARRRREGARVRRPRAIAP